MTSFLFVVNLEKAYIWMMMVHSKNIDTCPKKEITYSFIVKRCVTIPKAKGDVTESTPSHISKGSKISLPIVKINTLIVLTATASRYCTSSKKTQKQRLVNNR
jgi:hypothetical protein